MRNEDFFENLRQTLTETAEVVGKKAEDLVEIQKLHSRIRTAQRNVETDYKKIGEIIYQRYIEGELPGQELELICEMIMEQQKEIAGCKEELASKKGQVVCAVCGNGNPRDAAFCMHCGAVMPKGEQGSEKTEEAAETVESDAVQEAEEVADPAEETAEPEKQNETDEIASEIAAELEEEPLVAEE